MIACVDIAAQVAAMVAGASTEQQTQMRER
jgi:hypothetical protein